MAEQVLQHEAAHARARVDDGEDEERLEHDGEVIPEAEDGASAAAAREDVRHAQRQRGRAAGAVEERLLADVRRQRSASRARVTGKPQPMMVATAAARRRAHDAGRRVHREDRRRAAARRPRSAP